jgi:Zn ribbon nucleic-acid-binding protein
MHYVRKVDQGNDPRNRTYFIFKCTVCKHVKEFNWVPNFDTIQLRKCPNCGVVDDSNDKEYLIKRQHDLEQQIKEYQTRLALLTVELGKTTEKLAQFQEPQKIMAS